MLKQQDLFRSIALLLPLTVFGCASDESLTGAQHSKIRLGMSPSEVHASIGEPHHILKDALTQWREQWVYVYGIRNSGGSQDALEDFRAVAWILGFFGTIAALIYSGGTIPTSGSSHEDTRGWKGSTTKTWRFSVTFGPEGRVVEISEIW